MQINTADHFGGPRSRKGFETEEIAKKIEVRSDFDERFAQINEEGDMKDTVEMEMAQANAVVTKKFSQERMCRNPKPTNKICLEYNKLIGVEGRECLTCGGAPSSCHLVRKDAFYHDSLQGLLGVGLSDPL